jgi:hypothetical protein
LSSLANKLGIRPRVCVLLLDVPADVRELLEPLPDGAVIASTPPGDVVLAACTRRADVERHAPALIEAARMGAIVWGAWPKRTSGLDTDLTRDVGWEALSEAGLRGVATVSIDETWSGLRFRPVEDVRSGPIA